MGDVIGHLVSAATDDKWEGRGSRLAVVIEGGEVRVTCALVPVPMSILWIAKMGWTWEQGRHNRQHGPSLDGLGGWHH